MQLDLRLLKEERAKKPEDARVVFYLGQTYDLIGDLENALATYQARIDMGGWQQEVFEAHLRRVRTPLKPVFRVQTASVRKPHQAVARNGTRTSIQSHVQDWSQIYLNPQSH